MFAASATKSSPHSGGNYTGCENQEVGDHWGPSQRLPASEDCCWDTLIDLRPAHLQVLLPTDTRVGLNSLFHRQVLLIKKPKWPSSLTTRSLLTVMALVSPSFSLTRISSPPPHWSPRIYSAPLNFHPSLPPSPVSFQQYSGVFSKCRAVLSFYAENPFESSHIFCMSNHVSSRADKILQRLAHPES